MFDIFCFYIAVIFLSLCLLKWNKIISYVVFLFGSLLSLIDFFSMQILNTHINLLVLSSVDLTVLKMAPKVVPGYFWGGIAVLILHFAIPIYLYRLYKNKWEAILSGNRKRISLIVFCIAIIIAGSLYYNHQTAVAYKQVVKHSYNLYKNKDVSAAELMSRLGCKEKYPGINEIHATAGKNIVIIYCESLESNFLDTRQFPYETVKLNELSKKEMHLYSNYECAFGSGWTIAALYSTQTGFPCLFGANKAKLGGNSALTNIHKTEAVSYAGVLSKAGYKNVFMSNSSLKFAGTGKLMTLFGYECRSWKSFGKQVSKTKWGVHDYDLFQAAKKQFLKLNERKQPFNLTLLTIDTHYPKGVPDSRLRNKINKKIPLNSHEYTVASLDYLVDDFITFIEKNSGDKETVIVILGDHLMHGNAKVTPIVKKLGAKPRKVLLMSNKKIRDFESDEKIAFYDIPGIILNLAEIKTNAKFFKDLGASIDSGFIEKNQDIFTLLNMRLCQ